MLVDGFRVNPQNTLNQRLTNALFWIGVGRSWMVHRVPFIDRVAPGIITGVLALPR